MCARFVELERECKQKKHMWLREDGALSLVGVPHLSFIFGYAKSNMCVSTMFNKTWNRGKDS